MTRHTPGPWHVEFTYTGYADVGGNVFSTALLGGPGLDEARANAARIVACVNACEGIEDPAAALAEVRAALRHIVGVGIGVSPRVAEKALALLDTSRHT